MTTSVSVFPPASAPLAGPTHTLVGQSAPVVVVRGTVVTVVVVAGTVVVVARVVVVGGAVGLVVVGGSVVVVVVVPRVVVVVATVLLVVVAVVGGLVVLATTVPGETLGAAVTAVSLASALRNAAKRLEPRVAGVVVVDFGGLAAGAAGVAAPGAVATTDVGTGTNGTPVARRRAPEPVSVPANDVRGERTPHWPP